MVSYRALGVLATLALARIQTLLSDACQVVGTVSVQATFWPAGGRSALVASQTGAGSALVLLTAFRVRATWTRLTRVSRARWFG